MDEGQRLRHLSQEYAAVRGLGLQHIFIISGTPIEQNMSDIWAQMTLIWPCVLRQMKMCYRPALDWGDLEGHWGDDDIDSYDLLQALPEDDPRHLWAADPRVMYKLLQAGPKEGVKFAERYSMMEKQLMLRRSEGSILRVNETETLSLNNIMTKMCIQTCMLKEPPYERGERQLNHLVWAREIDRAKSSARPPGSGEEDDILNINKIRSLSRRWYSSSQPQNKRRLFDSFDG